MHIKQNPDDFRVEELIDLQPGQVGDYALYRLEKRGWTTPDALAAVRRRWHLDPWRLSYGGLKDRHAHTLQYITILRGPQRRFTQERIALTYLGQLAHPFGSDHVAANRFNVTLRDATAEQIEFALAQLDEVRRLGVPNYFDDQRFGSVADGGPFMARALILGNAEEALQIALTSPYRFDRAVQKKEKALLRTHWGAGRASWKCCRAAMPAAWSIISAITPPTSRAPLRGCVRSCVGSTCRPIRAICGIGCSAAGSKRTSSVTSLLRSRSG